MSKGAVWGLVAFGVFAAIYGGSNFWDWIHTQKAEGYAEDRICDPSLPADLDYREKNIRSFDVELTKGCFGPIIYPPKTWEHWTVQPKGDSKDWWVAFWVVDSRDSSKPFFPNNATTFGFVTPFRLQGNGVATVFSNVSLDKDAQKPVDKRKATSEPPKTEEAPPVDK